MAKQAKTEGGSMNSNIAEVPKSAQASAERISGWNGHPSRID